MSLTSGQNFGDDFYLNTTRTLSLSTCISAVREPVFSLLTEGVQFRNCL